MSCNFYRDYLKIRQIIFSQEILEAYEYDYTGHGPWVARHHNNAFDKSDPYSDWKFYDNNAITACPAYNKECSSGEGKCS